MASVPPVGRLQSGIFDCYQLLY